MILLINPPNPQDVFRIKIPWEGLVKYTTTNRLRAFIPLISCMSILRYGTELHLWYIENGFIENSALSSMTSYKSVIRTKKLTSVELQKFRNLASEAKETVVKEKALAANVQALEEHLSTITNAC